MATPFHTVSDEMAWTDWSATDDAVRPRETSAPGTTWGRMLVGMAIAVVALVAILHFLPTNG